MDAMQQMDDGGKMILMEAFVQILWISAGLMKAIKIGIILMAG